MPKWLEPMKAVLASHVPADASGWAFEIKWDGIRTLAFNDGRGPPHGFRLMSRNALDVTFRYPELWDLGRALGKRKAILDGEIIAIDAQGNPSFPELQKRMNVTTKVAVERAAREVPVTFVLFDVLFLDGRDLTGLPWEERRERLEGLADLLTPGYRLSPVRTGGKREGKEMLEAAREKELEGIMAKKMDSVYEVGRRSESWLKVKLVQRQELVVGGWVPEVSKDGKVRADHVGAVLLGYYDKGGTFHYAGAVGTGFDNRSSMEMVKRLRGLKTGEMPFAEDTEMRRFRAEVQWVRPEVVVEAEYRRWPAGGRMQQAAFKGVREDKSAREVMREVAKEV
jgi:bifunctional non-homologous end joining protein LigD